MSSLLSRVVRRRAGSGSPRAPRRARRRRRAASPRRRPRRASISSRTCCSSTRPWRTHCQICEREISAVAASSIRLSIAAAPTPCSQESRYRTPTETFVRTPASVISPGVSGMDRSAASSGTTSSRSRSSWFGRSPSAASKTSVQVGHEIGMRDPRAVEAVARLALLVLAHLRERDLVHLRILARRDERRHAADRVRAALVTRAHEQLGVRAHERHGHRHLDAVGQHPVARAELLDRAEDVVPAAGVERAAPVAQLVEDLLHLERGEDRLDQDGAADRPARDAELLLGERERVGPEPRLEVRLELREVEVRPAAALELLARVPRHVQAEVEERRRDRLAVDERVPLGQVPAARPDQERRDLVVQPVRLVRRLERDLAAHGVASRSAGPRRRSPTSASTRPRSRP